MALRDVLNALDEKEPPRTSTPTAAATDEGHDAPIMALSQINEA